MKFSMRWLGVAALGIASLGARGTAGATSGRVYAVIDVDAVGAKQLDAVKSTVKHEWFVEAEGNLLVLTTPEALKKSPRPYKILPVRPVPDQLYLIRMAHKDMLENLESDVLLLGGRHAVVQARTAYLESRIKHPSIEPFTKDLVLARQAANDPREKVELVFPAGTDQLVAQVDGEQWRNDVEKLASFNRYTHGTGITQARDWLVEQFRAIPDVTVTTESFRVSSTTAYNVVAKITGTTRPNDWYVVGAHYDAISENSRSTAPGAEDNGSGTAGLLAMARVIAAAKPAATIYFVAFSGEEQGLHGGYAHGKGIVDGGNKDKVKAMVNMDMIGYTGDNDLDVLLESDQRGAALYPDLKAAAEQFTKLRVATSLNPWGSDHVPFIELGIPAVLTIENDWDGYPSYHRSSDTPDKLSVPMAEETLKMNVALLWKLAS